MCDLRCCRFLPFGGAGDLYMVTYEGEAGALDECSGITSTAVIIYNSPSEMGALI